MKIERIDLSNIRLNDLRDLVFVDAKEKGWHTSEPNMGDHIANIHSETSELWEAHRRKKLDEPCDKSENMIFSFGETLSCKDEEVADILIRAFDTAAAYNVDVERALSIKMTYNRTRPYRNGNKLV